MKPPITTLLGFFARAIWLGWAIFLWVYWLVSVPVFLTRAAGGSLPTILIDNIVPAQLAVENAAAWGVTVGQWAWISVIANGLSLLSFSLVGLLIWLRVRSKFGLLTAFVLLFGGSNSMSMAAYSAELSALALNAWRATAIIWPLFMLWFYLFPNGKAIPRRLLWLLVPLLTVFSSVFIAYFLSNFLPVESVLYQQVQRFQPIGAGLAFPLVLIALAAQVYRYVRISTPSERQQTRWFLFGTILAFTPLIVIDPFYKLPEEVRVITFTALPLGIGISILRYRLWNIDRLIRKTLVYATLTAVLAFIYFGAIILIQNIFGSLVATQTPLVVVSSTLAIAALFNPLRRWIQEFIDRRFYRQKYDTARMLVELAETARDEVELERLTARLMHVVHKTLQPEQAAIWLKRNIKR